MSFKYFIYQFKNAFFSDPRALPKVRHDIPGFYVKVESVVGDISQQLHADDSLKAPYIDGDQFYFMVTVYNTGENSAYPTETPQQAIDTFYLGYARESFTDLTPSGNIHLVRMDAPWGNRVLTVGEALSGGDIVTAKHSRHFAAVIIHGNGQGIFVRDLHLAREL